MHHKIRETLSHLHELASSAKGQNIRVTVDIEENEKERESSSILEGPKQKRQELVYGTTQWHTVIAGYATTFFRNGH